MALLLLLMALLVVPSAAKLAPSSSSSFSLDFFPPAAAAIAIAQLSLSGASSSNATSAAGSISMRSPHAQVQYANPISFSPHATGFSTYFSFSFSLFPNSPPPNNNNASLAFFLTAPPAPSQPNLLLAVVFFATGHIRIDLAGGHTIHYWIDYNATSKKLHSWIDYNATSAMLQVRLSASRSRLPQNQKLLSYYPVHLSTTSKNPMLAGFRFASSAANCSLFNWAFHATSYQLMHSQPLDPAHLLTTPPPPPPPPPPPERLHRAPPPDLWPWASLLLAAACGAMLTFFILFIWYSVTARRPVAPVADVVYEKIVLVGVKDADVAAAGNK